MTQTRLGLIVVLMLILAAPTHAQWAVIDIANLAQTSLIVERARRHLEEVQAQSRTLLRMAQGLGSLERYRLPAVPIATHDPARWTYGQAWLEALTRGDPSGAGYRATTVPIEPVPAAAERLRARARAQLDRQRAAIEIADAVAMLGGHQVGVIRGAHTTLQTAVDALERDVLSTATGAHDLTAVLDKVAAGELLARRQDLATNQLLTHALEQLLTRSQRQRETEAHALAMRLVTWRDGPAANAAFVAGSGEALRTWRQP